MRMIALLPSDSPYEPVRSRLSAPANAFAALPRRFLEELRLSADQAAEAHFIVYRSECNLDSIQPESATK